MQRALVYQYINLDQIPDHPTVCTLIWCDLLILLSCLTFDRRCFPPYSPPRPSYSLIISSLPLSSLPLSFLPLLSLPPLIPSSSSHTLLLLYLPTHPLILSSSFSEFSHHTQNFLFPPYLLPLLPMHLSSSFSQPILLPSSLPLLILSSSSSHTFPP